MESVFDISGEMDGKSVPDPSTIAIFPGLVRYGLSGSETKATKRLELIRGTK